MPRRHLVDAHCFGADRRPRLTDDDRSGGATANQARSGERGCANAKKFHANLTSCPIAKLRFNVVAAAVSRDEVPHTIGYADFYSRSHDAVIRVYDYAAT